MLLQHLSLFLVDINVFVEVASAFFYTQAEMFRLKGSKLYAQIHNFFFGFSPFLKTEN